MYEMLFGVLYLFIALLLVWMIVVPIGCLVASIAGRERPLVPVRSEPPYGNPIYENRYYMTDAQLLGMVFRMIDVIYNPKEGDDRWYSISEIMYVYDIAHDIVGKLGSGGITKTEWHDMLTDEQRGFLFYLLMNPEGVEKISPPLIITKSPLSASPIREPKKIELDDAVVNKVLRNVSDDMKRKLFIREW